MSKLPKPSKKPHKNAVVPAATRRAAAQPLAKPLHALYMQAVLHHQAGALEQAAALYAQVVQAQPTYSEAWHYAGMVAHARGDYANALLWIGHAIDLHTSPLRHGYTPISHSAPQLGASFYNSLGLTQEALQQPQAALQSFDKAIALDPTLVAAHSNKGNVLQTLGQWEAAVASYERALELNPAFANIWFNRGNALRSLQRSHAAIASYSQALVVQPGYADALANRGTVYQTLGDLEQALADCQAALALGHHLRDAHYNCGHVLQAMGQLDAAQSHYTQALALQSDYAPARWNLGLTQLLSGDFENGWPNFEHRWRAAMVAQQRHFAQPLWLGEQDIAGKTILLHAEQGLGDTLQFCRYAVLVADVTKARVLLEVQAPLQTVLQDFPGVDTLLVRGEPLPHFDVHCPLMSLPLAFGTRLDNIPAAPHYLLANADRRAHWAAVVERHFANFQNTARQRPLRIGLVWSGNLHHVADAQRSIPLAMLLEHLCPEPAPSHSHLQLVSLQKEVRDADLATLQAHPQILDAGTQLHDFADTAALCSALDMVVSVDTSVAHLSAALGQATCILLPYCPDWRWLLKRSDSPWYPSVRLYRQNIRNTWDDVLAQLAQHLRLLAASPAYQSPEISAPRSNQGQ